MNPIDFQLMNRTDLRKYIAKNPHNRQAFYFYMDMLANQPVLANGTALDLKDLNHLTQIIKRTINFKLQKRD